MELWWGPTVLVALFLAKGSMASPGPPDVIQGLKQRVRFHLEGLKRSVESIHALRQREGDFLDIETRSLEDIPDWDTSVAPVLSFCKSIKSVDQQIRNEDQSVKNSDQDVPNSDTENKDRDHDIRTTRPPSPATIYTSQDWERDGVVLSTQGVSIQSLSKEYGRLNSEWFLPDVRPLRAQAERNGTKVRVVFDVLHPWPALVARVESFQFARVHLNVTSDNVAHFLSKVQFVTDATACRSVGMDFTSTYLFDSKEENETGTGSVIRVDTCGFDKYHNESLGYGESSWLTKPDGVFSQIIEYPKFRILPKTTMNVTIRQGHNEVFDVDVNLDGRISFFLSASFYDYTAEKRIEESKSINVWSGEIGEPRIMNHTSEETNIFNVKVIKKDNFVNKSVNEQISININLTLRITVLTGSGRTAGSLFLTDVLDSRSSYYERNVLSSVTSYQTVTFQLPGRSYPPPNTTPVIYNRKIFRCTEEGNAVRPLKGINCTLECRAHGPGITGISIRKTDANLVPFRNVSYVLHNTAYSMIDVGRASEVNGGAYQCTAETSNKTVQELMTLYTAGFPKIFKNSSSIVQFPNGTTEVICQATGAPPFNMFVVLDMENGTRKRIDNETDYSRITTPLENGMILKLRLPTNDLKYPSRTLDCRAMSDRGADVATFYLYNEIKDYYEFVAPKVDKESTRIVRLPNGTTMITCKASGAPPLDLHISQWKDGTRVSLDNNTSVTKSETTTADGKTVSFFLNSPRRVLGRRPWTIYCLVSNKHARDDYYFHRPRRNG